MFSSSTPYLDYVALHDDMWSNVERRAEHMGVEVERREAYTEEFHSHFAKKKNPVIRGSRHPAA